MTYLIQYLGETINEAFDLEEAQELRDEIVDDIMKDKIPSFLTHEDFDSHLDCFKSIEIVEVDEDGSQVAE